MTVADLFDIVMLWVVIYTGTTYLTYRLVK